MQPAAPQWIAPHCGFHRRSYAFRSIGSGWLSRSSHSGTRPSMTQCRHCAEHSPVPSAVGESTPQLTPVQRYGAVHHACAHAGGDGHRPQEFCARLRTARSPCRLARSPPTRGRTPPPLPRAPAAWLRALPSAPLPAHPCVAPAGQRGRQQAAQEGVGLGARRPSGLAPRRAAGQH